MARQVVIEEMRIKEEEYSLPDQECIGREGRFYLSALPFVVGPGELGKSRKVAKPQPKGLGILSAGMKIKRIEAERYFAEIIRKTTEEYAGLQQQTDQQDEVIGSYVEIAMSKKHH